jgi:ADP-heptose:LPS heptosyltransferase
VVVENEALRAAATRVVAPMPPDFPLYGPSASVAREISPDFAEPRTMSFPRLAQRWRETPKKYVVLFPMSDEPRKNMPADEVEALYRLLKERHADKEVLVLVRNRREVAMFSRTPQVPLTTFHDVPTLGRFFLQSAAYYGVDTGPMHLALGMGMPCTVFFGPTQPHRVIPVEQADVVALREAVLGRRHCDVTSCTRPVCISRTVARFVGREAKEEELLAACPLRAAPVRK